MNEITDTANYTQAITVHRRIMANAQAAQESLYEVCKGLKEMRDGKLYKELGYQNFEDYTENEVGIKRHMARKYITIIENVDSSQHFEKLGVSKLYLLSTISKEERTEIAENTDLENTSVKELEAKIKALQYENEKIAREAELDRKEQQDANAAAMRFKEDAQREAQKRIELEKSVEKLRECNYALERDIKELENRPIEVAVQEDTKEIENLKSIIKQTDLEWSQKYTALEEEGIKRTGEEERRHKAELEKVIAEYEAKLSQLPEPEKEVVTETVTDDTEVFRAYLSMAAEIGNKLLEFIRAHNDNSLFVDKTREYFRIMLEKAGN